MSETSAAGARILLASPDTNLRTTREDLLRKFGFEVSASRGDSDSLELLEVKTFDLLVIGHSLSSQAATRLATAFRGHNPRGRVVEIASTPDMPPLNNPDASVVGLDGPAALRTVLEAQLQIANCDLKLGAPPSVRANM